MALLQAAEVVPLSLDDAPKAHDFKGAASLSTAMFHVPSVQQPVPGHATLQTAWKPTRSRERALLRRAPARHALLACTWIEPRTCARCGNIFRERDNLQAYQCSAHPLPPDSITGDFRCCGASSIRGDPSFLWWRAAGCIRAHHISRHLHGYHETDPPSVEIPESVFEIVPVSLCEPNPEPHAPARPFLPRLHRRAVLVRDAASESKGIVYADDFTESTKIMYPKHWDRRTIRIGMTAQEAADEYDATRAAATFLSYLEPDVAPAIPSTYFEPYYLIPRFASSSDPQLYKAIEAALERREARRVATTPLRTPSSGAGAAPAL